ncbi:MAG TPA: hypothetical protein PJ987_09550 [Bacteroidia bacterium]|nr:hypothetical protein [Bacteroidia bacterium]HMY42177.1 hypothetical protein [Chitinophagales bacterium]
MKYYDIHVYDGINSFSVFMQVKDGLLLPIPEKQDIVGHAIDTGVLDPNDMEFVDKVTPISEEEYNKAIKA